MKKNNLWMLAAILTCGLATLMFTSCANGDLPVASIVTDNIDLIEPLTIEAVEDGKVDLYLDSKLPEPIYYTVNGGEKQMVKVWHETETEEGESTTLNLKAGDKVQLFSKNTTMHNAENTEGFYIFFDPACYVYGNVMSLITPDGNWLKNKTIKEPYALASLLGSTNIVTHPTRRLMLPATKLSEGCYTHMFEYSKIEVAPELPATTLVESCYSSMFKRCAKLSSVTCMATTMTGEYALMSWLDGAGTDKSITTLTLTHAAGTAWVNSDEYSIGLTDWFVPTGWTLVKMQ